MDSSPLKRNAADRIVIAFCVASLVFLLAGGLIQIKRPVLDISALAPVNPKDPPIQGAGFAPDAVFSSTPAAPYRGGAIGFYGSWLSSGGSTGSVHSRWFPAVPRFAIFFSGYPDTPGESLSVEVLTANSGVMRLPVPPELVPGESWWVREIALPQAGHPLKFRLVAIDGSTTSQGWIGFSDPFVIREVDGLQIAKQMLLILLVSTASFTVFLAPGLFLREKYRRMSFIWLPAPGILTLALLGLASWMGPHALKPRWISRLGLALLIAFATYHFVRAPLSRFTTSVERRVLMISVSIACIAVAKSVYSLGPAGELYSGRLSRTLEPGGRADSRISYHGVQLVALRSGPHSQFAAGLYYPWDFSSRGPLASLAVSPIVLSSPVQVSTVMPDAPWELFDPEGFASFRIAMIVIASCALIPVFGMAKLFLNDDWAFLAFLIAASAPFMIHEVYFTWPKLLAASFTLQAAYLAFRSRYLFAGLVLGLGYLAHPSTLLWFPALAAIAFVASKPRFFSSWPLRVLSMALGVGLWVLFWLGINREHFAQNYFLSYFSMTATYTPTPAHWLQSRLESLLNTLIPLNLFLFHRDSPEITSVYASSPPLIRFFFQYWNTLPFGVGIGFFLCYLLRAIWIGLLKAAAWLWLVFVIPFAFFVAYWGMSSGGLAREGLHAWMLGLLIFSVVIWKRFPPQSNTFWRFCNYSLLFRGFEILAMMLLPVIASNQTLAQRQFEVSDILALLAMVGGTGFLCAYLFVFAERLRCNDRRLAQTP